MPYIKDYKDVNRLFRNVFRTRLDRGGDISELRIGIRSYGFVQAAGLEPVHRVDAALHEPVLIVQGITGPSAP